MPIISPYQHFDDIQKKRCENLAHHYPHSIQPILTVTANSNERPISLQGSCLLLKLNPYYFLVTAKHVIDGLQGKPFWIVGSDNHTHKVNAVDVVYTEEEKGGLDLALIRFNPNEIIKENWFYPYSRLYQNIDKPAAYIVYGFPYSKNKKINITKQVDTYVFRLLYYPEENDRIISEQRSDPKRNFRLNKFDNIAFNMDRENFEDNTQKDIPMIPHPRGMSGGPIFYANTLNDVNYNGSVNLTLVGIFTHYDKDKKICWGSRITDGLLESLRLKYPFLYIS